MKSNPLQELVKKVFSSEETKSQFMANPDSVISRFDLSKTEKKAVLATHTRFGLVTGDSAQLGVALRATSGWNAPIP